MQTVDWLRRVASHRARPIRSGVAAGLRRQGGLGIRENLTFLLQPEPDTAEERFYKSLDLAAKVVYDVGAFDGINTIFFAERVGALGQVIAFEPNPSTYEQLLANVRVNGFANVTAVPLAVGRDAGELEFAVADGGRGRMSANGEIVEKLASEARRLETLTVPVASIDGVVAERGLPAPDFVKIDVEGLEHDVLLGMRETIGAHRPELFVELHGVGEDGKRENARRVADLLLGAGYELRHVESGGAVAVPEDAPPTGHLAARADT